MTWTEILKILAIAGIPSLVTAFVFYRIMNRLDEDKKVRDKNMLMLIGLSYTAVELSEAVAVSYKNQRCNGEITAALDKAKTVKDEYTEFLRQQCIKGM